MGLVSLPLIVRCMQRLTCAVREHGIPEQSEFTVVKTETYNGINKYLLELSTTDIRTLEDIVSYNEANKGTEGAKPGDVPAFPNGQDNFYEIVAHAGRTDDTYYKALEHIHKQSRENGIDAALQYHDDDGHVKQLDAILVSDDKGAGQQLAAQAGYPIITIPVGLDSRGMPVGLSIHHTAWEEGRLIMWASAIENLLRKKQSSRPTPTYRNHLSKNIPISK